MTRGELKRAILDQITYIDDESDSESDEFPLETHYTFDFRDAVQVIQVGVRGRRGWAARTLRYDDWRPDRGGRPYFAMSGSCTVTVVVRDDRVYFQAREEDSTTNPGWHHHDGPPPKLEGPRCLGTVRAVEKWLSRYDDAGNKIPQAKG